MSIEENKITDILDDLRAIAKKSNQDLKIVMTKDEIQIYLSLAEKSKPSPPVKKSKLPKEEWGEFEYLSKGYGKKSNKPWDGLEDLL